AASLKLDSSHRDLCNDEDPLWELACLR
ncbi:hypothetical protein ACVWVP_005785, partial [Pseudomonas sp. TE24901]